MAIVYTAAIGYPSPNGSVHPAERDLDTRRSEPEEAKGEAERSAGRKLRWTEHGEYPRRRWTAPISDELGAEVQECTVNEGFNLNVGVMQ